MRILLSNKFYYRRGGDCIYSIELESLLKAAGHEVAFFAMDFPENLSSPWSKYWPREVAFSPKKPGAFIRAFMRPFGDSETVKKFTAMLDEFKPDVLHLNNIHTQLSPVLAEIARARGVKVVWTLHDYKLVCPAYTCYSHGEICEECIGGSKKPCSAKCCVKNKLGSIIAQKEAESWNCARLEKCVDKFVCPSAFMKAKMEQGGFDSSKLIALHNFIDEAKVASAFVEKEDCYCYVGRLSQEKGVRTLLKVAAQKSQTLYVLGTGPLSEELKAEFATCSQIKFMGHCDWNTCKAILLKSKFSVISSEWYENNPLSVIESLSLGTPVLGANIGGIPELIEPGVTGELFKSGDAEDLSKKVDTMFGNSYSYDAAALCKLYSRDNYLKQILDIYG
ncbi:MAG: glycosyltransferase [Fibrobacter sp.]|nr:glycosyltransferase [Fibrobacter sp.]